MAGFDLGLEGPVQSQLADLVRSWVIQTERSLGGKAESGKSSNMVHKVWVVRNKAGERSGLTTEALEHHARELEFIC